MAQEPSALDQTASAFEAAMAESEGEVQQPVNEQVEGAEAEQAQDVEATEQEQPAEEQEQPEAKADDAETIEIDPDEPLFEFDVEVDGKKEAQKLSLKELQGGYLRQADYTRKTQALAQERAKAQQEARAAVEQATKTAMDRLNVLQDTLMQAVAPEFANVDWNKLSAEDPAEYVRLSNRAHQIQMTMQQIEAAKKEAKTKAEQEEQQRAAEEWQKSLEVLQRDIPDWSPEVVQSLIGTAKEYGFSDEEARSLRDARVIKLLDMARKSKAVVEQKPVAEKKVALVRKVLKPGTKPAKPTVKDQAFETFKKTKSVESAAAVFDKLLG